MQKPSPYVGVRSSSRLEEVLDETVDHLVDLAIGEDGPHVTEDGILSYAGDNRDLPPLHEMFGAVLSISSHESDLDREGVYIVHRKGASASARNLRYHRYVSVAIPEGSLERVGEPLRTPPDRFRVLREHAQRRNLAQSLCGVQIEAKRRLEARERHLVEAEHPGERIRLQPIDVLP